MAVADNRQREMPTEDDRDIERGHAKVLGYKEAVQLTHPHNSMFKNQVINLFYTVLDSIFNCSCIRNLEF